MKKNQQKTKDSVKNTSYEYVITFYQYVEALNENYSYYVNLLLEISARAEKDDKTLNTLINQDKNSTFTQILSNLRHSIIQTYLKIMSMSNINKSYDTIKIQEYYNKMINEYIINSGDALVYVQEVNKFIVTDVMQDLISNASDFYTELQNG